MSFGRKLNIRINYDTFHEEDYFRDLHYYEKYDPTKKYNGEYYEKDYGKGTNTYQCELWNLIYDENKKLQYVVAMEQLTKDQRMQLVKYCKCNRCNAFIWNKYNIEPFGCIKYENYPNQGIIDKAKISLHKSNSSFFKKLF